MSTPQPKFCPLLTAAVMKSPQPESKLVDAAGQKHRDGGFDAVPCAGPMCAFFTPVHDERGHVRGGNCAVTLVPSAVAMLNDSIRTAAALKNAASN